MIRAARVDRVALGLDVLEQERPLGLGDRLVEAVEQHRHELVRRGRGDAGLDADLAVGAGEGAGAAVGEGSGSEHGAKVPVGLAFNIGIVPADLNRPNRLKPGAKVMLLAACRGAAAADAATCCLLLLNAASCCVM